MSNPATPPPITATLMPSARAVMITGLSRIVPVIDLDEDAAQLLHAALTRALATRHLATRQADLFADASAEAGWECAITSPENALRVEIATARAHIDRAADWQGREGGLGAIVAATLRASAHALTAAQIAQAILDERIEP